MTDLVIWPRSLLQPHSGAPNMAPATIAGPAALSGDRQTVASPAAVWVFKYEAIRVRQAQVLLWRALAAQVEGRTTPILLPVYDRDRNRPLGVAAGVATGHGDGSTFGDGSSYASNRAQFLAAAAVARGAIRMTATKILGTALEPGQHFSVGYRLYRIKAIEAVAGADTTFTFWPPAREAIIAGSEMEFDAPVCKVRLTDDRGLDLDPELGRHAFPTVSFMEDVR